MWHERNTRFQGKRLERRLNDEFFYLLELYYLLHQFDHVSLGGPQMYCVALKVHQRLSMVERQLVGNELSEDVIESLLAGAIHEEHRLVVNHVE